ncbi:MAG: PD40 domain-containing protein [Anaerolineae bacterium]|nr:PD40 domain-containing protein [Anaerolineae bacterium]
MLRYLTVFMLMISCLILTGRPAQAHPADMYFQTHTIHLTPAGLRLTWSVFLGPLLVPLVYTDVDRNRDQAVSSAEAQAWAEIILPGFSVAFDDSALAWRLEGIEWPTDFNAMQTGDETILIHLAADWPANLAGEHQLTLNNQYQEAISVNWFYLHGLEGVLFQKPTQDNGRLEVDFLLPESSETTPVAADEEWQTYWDSGTPSLPALASRAVLQSAMGQTVAASAEANRPIAVLTDLVRAPELSAPFYLLALGIAVVLGALHSLTPGHGKTVVAAYLIGSRGTTLHAISLGTIVTLTHTGSVFVLGLITLAASQYILPTHLSFILEIISGLLIVGLGASLLYQRWRIWRKATVGDDGHHNDGHHHDHPHDGHHHHHHHHHDHSPGHHHHHHHDHSPDHHHHHAPLAGDVSWRSLVALGVSGGLVPCPDAIAILLVAIALNRIMLGLSLIVAFSLGLAVVLIFIGLAMVHSRRLFDKMDAFNRWAPLMPVASAVIVLALGLVLTIAAFRNIGVFTTGSEFTQTAGLPPNAAQTEPLAIPPPPPFVIDRAGILYMDGDEQGKSQIFRLDLAGGTSPRQLTPNPLGVQGYALSPDGARVVYTAMRDDGGSDLGLVNVDGNAPRELLTCPDAACGGAVWSPDGGRLVYERINPTSQDATAGLPSLWWFEMETGETGPIFQDSRWPGFNPRWSPDGLWLSYVYPGSGKMELYHLADGRRNSLNTQTGAPVVWSPRGEGLLVTNVWDAGQRSLIHLFRYDLETETMTDLSEASKPGDKPVMDSAAAWSPDGQWLVVVRRGLTPGGATTGSWLWLMRPDGSEGRALTEESEMIYGTPVWSPDGNYLLFHTYSLAEALATKIFILNVETGETQEVVGSGSRPDWVY